VHQVGNQHTVVHHELTIY